MKKKVKTGHDDSADLRRRGGEALRKSEEESRLLIENSPDIIYTLTLEGVFLSVSPAWTVLLGHPVTQVVGKPFQQFIHPDDLARYQAFLQRTIEPGQRQTGIEYRVQHADGTWRWHISNGFPVKDEAGTVVVYGGIASDITDRKPVEEARRESEDRSHLIFENMRDTAWLMDMSFKTTWISPSAVRTRGFKLEELQDSTLDRHMTPASIALMAELTARHLSPANLADKNKEVAIDGEFEFYRKDGTTFLGDTVATLLRDREGAPVGFLCVVRDITERKKAKEETQSLARFPSENPEPVLRIARDGTLLYINAAGLSLLPQWPLQVGQAAPPMLREAVFQSIDNGSTQVLDLEHSERVYSFFVTPIVAAGYANLYGRDITERKRAQEALCESEERYRELFEKESDALMVLDAETHRFEDVNAAALILYGYTREEFLALSAEDISAEPDQTREKIDRIVIGDPVPSIPVRYQKKKDGTAFPVEISRGGFFVGGRPKIFGAVRDITERKWAEEVLQESEEKYRVLIDTSNESIVVAQDGLLKFVNPAAIDLLGGYSEQELMDRPFPEFIYPDDRSMVVENYRRRIANEALQPRYSFRVVTRDGIVKWVEINAALIKWQGKPATLNFLTDITERKRAEDAVQASLREKEILLREIHHRVKNNMQIISSLFNLQAGHIKDEDARKMLKEGQLRIRSMAIVHDKLYQSSDLSKIDFADYLRSLSVHLFHFFMVEADRIRLETDLEDIHLDINSAVPCGLLVTELMTNALKHAFPGDRKGVVGIRIRRREDGIVELRVADDGVGFPEAVDFRHTESLGLQIVSLLVGQLEGTIELDRKKGTAFTIAFRELERTIKA